MFTSSAKRCWFAFSWVTPHTGGGWTGDLLFQEVQVDTCRGTVIFPCADGSIKQEGHVVPRPHRLRLLLQVDQDAGGDFDAHRHPQPSSSARGDSCCRTRSSCGGRTISGAFQAIDLISRHIVGPRGRLYVSSEPSFPILLKCNDVIRQTKTIWEESIIDDFWDVVGHKTLSVDKIGFVKSEKLQKRPRTVHKWVSGM